MHRRTLLASLLLAVSHLAMAAPTVVDFGPHGLTREVRQVRLRFSDEMVALGDSAAPDAASVSCGQGAFKASGHWIDGRNWVAGFATPLPDSVACTVTPAAYVLRLNNAGSFVFPPTRVEAMYAPEIFGEAPNAPLVVKP